MALEQMKQQASNASRLMKALANERRLLILCNLIEGELSVKQLTERLQLSQSALSQHLAILREDELVQTRRQSQTIFYSITAGPATVMMDTLHRIYCGTR